MFAGRRRDGVPDGIDQCANTPLGTKVDAVGCPIAVVAVLASPPPASAPICPEGQKCLVLEGVYFETGKATLTPESHAVLDGVAASLNHWPDIRVEIAGHTDSVGGEAYNLRLSEARSAAVRNYLITAGVDASRMTSRGYGFSRSVGDNNSTEGRASNRRVEMDKID